MIRELNVPDHSRGYFSELVSRESSRFQALSPIKHGSFYAAGTGADQQIADAFPGLKFLRETVPLSGTVNGMPTDQWVVWLWATGELAQETYDAAVSYLGDAVANPVFTRVSTIPRKDYEASPTVALGSPLTALIGVKVTAGGTGYTYATIAISGGGSGAAAEAVIDQDGAIAEVIVTNSGTGYTTAPTVTASGDGSGATLAGIIQPQGAILTSQSKKELPPNDPESNSQVEVTRVYELLPGPILPYTRWDETLGQIQGFRQAVVYASQPASLTATARITYEAREGSSYVAWKVSETNSDGTGSGGNPAYPILTKDFYDEERGAIQQVTQAVVATGPEAGTETESGGTVTKTDYEPINQFLLKKIVETYAVPGPVLTKTFINEKGDITTETRRLAKASTIATTTVISGGVWTRTFEEPYSSLLAWKIVQVRDAANAMPAYEISIPDLVPEEFRAQVPTDTTETTVVGTAALPSLATGDLRRKQEQIDEFSYRLTVTGRAGLSLPVTISGIKETNAQKQVVSVSMTLEADSTSPTAPTATTDVEFRELGNGTAIEIIKTIPSVFDAVEYAKTRPDNVPERFKAGNPATTEKHTVSGSASAPSLSTGDVEKSERQLDSFVKETALTTRPVESYPTLEGQSYDETLNVVIPYTEQILSAGSGIGTNQREITPLGAGLELSKSIDISAIAAALNAYMLEFPGSASVALPPVLTSLSTVVETMVGAGDDGLDFVGFGFLSGHGAWSLAYPAQSTGSAAIIPDVIEGIEQAWGHNKPTRHYLFFLPSPVTIGDVITKLGGEIRTWPDWNPKSVTIVATSRKVSLQVKASTSISSGGSSDSGEGSQHQATGASREVTISTKTIRIPPTIHGSFSLSLGTTHQDVTVHAYSTLSASGTVGITGTSTANRSETDTATASISPSSISATSGATSIIGGDYVFNVDAAPYRYGYCRVHAEVVTL